MNERSRRLAGNVERGRAIQLRVDGQLIPAYEGETVAAALLAAGRRIFRHRVPGGDPRGIFCGIGMCFDCLVTVDGTRIVRACVTPVRDGMQVTILEH
ncbi:MAG: (2Fe-2S)-binding protein [Candidatus Methylomirabilales bacterium]